MTLPLSRLTLFWLLLMAVTALSFESSLHRSMLAGAAVIVAGVLKAWIIGREFMELRHAPFWFRCLFDAWAVILLGALTGVFFLVG